MYASLISAWSLVRKYSLPALILISSILGIFSALFGQSIAEIFASQSIDLNRIHYTVMAMPVLAICVAYFTYWLQRERYRASLEALLKSQVEKMDRVAGLDHDMAHVLRDSGACIAVLSLNNALDRNQFDSELDGCLASFSNALAETFTSLTGSQTSAAVHLIADDGAKDIFSFQSRDAASAKSRRSGLGGRLSCEQLSTGMREIVDSCQPFQTIASFENIPKNFPEYQDTLAENSNELYQSAVVVSVQLVLKSFVRRRHEPLFTESPRIVAGFLTLESMDPEFAANVQKEVASRLADTLFLGLELFALAEVRQFGSDGCTMGKISDGLFKPELKIVGGVDFSHPSSAPK